MVWAWILSFKCIAECKQTQVGHSVARLECRLWFSWKVRFCIDYWFILYFTLTALLAEGEGDVLL
jgi:hypothetical protein